MRRDPKGLSADEIIGLHCGSMPFIPRVRTRDHVEHIDETLSERGSGLCFGVPRA